MPVSLEQISRELGDKKREASALSSKLQAAITSFDEKRESLGKLRDAVDAIEGDVPEDKIAELKKLENEVKEARLALVGLNDSIALIKSEVEDLEQDLSIRKSSNAMEDFLKSKAGRAGSDGASLHDAAGLSSEARVLPPSRDQMEHHLGVFLQCTLLARLDRVDPSALATDFFQNEHVASAMSAHDHGRGGSFVHGQFADFYIELLAERAILRSLGVPTVPIIDGSLTVPKITDGVIGGYRGEEEDIAVEEMSTGDITLTAKELSLLVPLTEKLLRSKSASAARMVREEMVRAGTRLEDSKFLRGAKNSAGPTGLRYRAGHIIPFSGAVTPDAVVKFIALMELALQESSVGMTNPCWITSYRTIKFLEILKDDEHSRSLFPEVKDGRINRFPFKATNYIPSNITASAVGGDPSTVGYTELMLLDVDEQIIGDVDGVRFDVSNEASYTTPTGQLVNCFQRGQVLFRLQMENDIHTRHAESIAVGVDIEWAL